MLCSVDDADEWEHIAATANSAVQERLAGTQDEIKVRYVENCMSAEWLAVIFVFRCRSVSHTVALPDNTMKKITCSPTIPFLYVGLSRARVYSTIIVRNYVEDTCEYTDQLFAELRQRQDVCKLIDIKNTDNVTTDVT